MICLILLTFVIEYIIYGIRRYHYTQEEIDDTPKRPCE